MKYFFILVLTIFLFTSCKPQIDLDKLSEQSSNLPKTSISDLSLTDILKAKKLIAIANGNALYLVDPEYPKPYLLYGFNENERPVSRDLQLFSISPSKNWLVWYTPTKGIIALNVLTLETKLIQSADDFLNTYPYVEFAQDQDLLYFIADKGNTFVQVELNNNQSKKIAIPYPYGNVFKIAPDQNKLLFISGFGQSQKPQFMITDKEGSLLKQFSAEIDQSFRHSVFWHPNNSGIFMPKANNIQFYAIDKTSEPEIFFSFADDVKILEISLVNMGIFTLTNDGYWHIIDVNTGKETARAPLAIASELQSPKFFPWQDKQFLIEESVSDNLETFNRLWLSDFKGVKKLVMEKYNEVLVQSFPEKLD